MPIPKPKDGESKDDFLNRCMGNDLMNDEYPDEKQRYAICLSQWEEKKDMGNKKEIRAVNDPAKVKVRKDGTPGSIYGYAIVYNKKSEDMGFIEKIAPGAAKKALKRSDIRALKNHDPSLIFGRQGVNLKLTDDETGLRYEATPIDTRNFRETAEEVRAGLLTGQSFGFTILSDKWENLDTDRPTRTITEIDEIFDVGPVTYPAYTDTTVALRSLEAARSQEADEFEDDETETEEEKIIIIVNDESFDFTGEDRLDRAADKINSLRSSSSAITSDEDSTEESPMTTPSSAGLDEVLERINKIEKKYERKVN